MICKEARGLELYMIDLRYVQLMIGLTIALSLNIEETCQPFLPQNLSNHLVRIKFSNDKVTCL